MVFLQPALSRADIVGRSLIGLAALAALYAAIAGFSSTVDPQAGWLALWQNWGFVMFAGLFGLLALRPRLSPGLWELAFVNKLALAITGLSAPALPGAVDAGAFDAALAIVLALAYWLTRGWLGWQTGGKRQ